jgi:hypothetical protein
MTQQRPAGRGRCTVVVHPGHAVEARLDVAFFDPAAQGAGFGAAWLVGAADRTQQCPVVAEREAAPVA